LRKPRVYIGLGSNLGDREANLDRALDVLDGSIPPSLIYCSGFYETEPVGVIDQPNFLNAVASVDPAKLSPREVLDRLLEIERELGRDRSKEQRWGPRIIDLDLLLYGDEVIDEPGLTVPHPRLAERRFVLEPLVELAPKLVLPDGRRVKDLLALQLE
jgi:2-amino-4-hydroxy-6-hydroxymethyldihydropteridine diphosphokinase